MSPTSSPEPLGSTPSPVPPLVSPDRVPVRPQRTSSASSLSSSSQTGRTRPKTAPPDPPVRTAEGSASKKPVSRLSATTSENQLAADRSFLAEEYSPTQYSRIAVGVTARKMSQGDDSSTIYNRMSLTSSQSRNSSDTYLTIGDLASAPPRQRSGIAEDPRAYLSLQSPTDSEELYMSSHFPDEPLYQFYTAAIIERAAQNQGEGSEEDDYEVIGERLREEDHAVGESSNRLPTAMELVTPSGGRRTLWCELPQVIRSGLLGESAKRKVLLD